MGENMSGGTPTQAQLKDWAQTYDIQHPVVADAGWDVTVGYAGYSFGLPSMHLLGPGLEVLARGTWVSEEQIKRALP